MSKSNKSNTKSNTENTAQVENTTPETGTGKTGRKNKAPSFTAARVIENTGTEPMSIELQPGETILRPIGDVTASQSDAKGTLGNALELGQSGAVIRYSFGPKIASLPKRTVSAVILR